MGEMRITITDGPYIIEGGVTLYLDEIVESDDGSHLEYHRVKEYDVPEKYALCRCGRSKKAPFCDGSHVTVKPPFEAPETADRSPYSKRAKVFPGDGVDLYDDGRCAFARLCHKNGQNVWKMAREAKRDEFKLDEIHSAWNCPTGRLTIADAMTSQHYEQEFEPSIIILEDGGLKCSGPIFVRGGIELLGEDGYVYEKRNRYALCRCGHSSTMPFCDATHHHIGFDDGYDGFGKPPEESGTFDDSFKY